MATPTNPSKYVPSDMVGRTVYKNVGDVNPGVPGTLAQDATSYMSPTAVLILRRGGNNADLMRAGYSPIGPDGYPIELHHLLGGEPGPMVELTRTFHQTNKKALHGLIEDGASFRKGNAAAERRYDRWRKKYWQERARDF